MLSVDIRPDLPVASTGLTRMRTQRHPDLLSNLFRYGNVRWSERVCIEFCDLNPSSVVMYEQCDSPSRR